MKQKAVRKRVLTILLSAALIVTMLPSAAIEAFAESDPVIIWEYSLDGDENATITSYQGNESALIIPETIDGYTVTKIGSSTFYGNTVLRDVVIPDSVTEIGSYAFWNCQNLESISLSHSLKSLGSRAFSNCIALNTIEIPKSLEQCNLSSNMTTGEYYGPFSGCDMLKTVTFERGTSSIVEYLMYGCDGLEQIKIPDTVTKIGRMSFSECENLNAVEITNLVTTIDDAAFKGCVALNEITIPDSVTEIGSQAFYKCINLESISLSKGLKSLGIKALGNCTSLTMVEIPKSLEICETSRDSTTGDKYGPFAGCDMLKTVTFEEGTSRIVDSLLCGCDGIEGIRIPDTVTKIGRDSFYRCKNLKEVEIPNSVTTIDSNAFSGCVKLREISIPDSVFEIRSSAFCDCKSLESVVLPKTLEGLIDSTFSGCKALSQITLPETLTYIGSYAFSDSGLTEIEIPKNVTRIGDGAFKNCISLENLVIRDSKATIGSSAFSGCDAMTKIMIPDSVTALGSNIFEHCDSLSDVSLSAGITEIPKFAFNQCASLEKIKIPYNVTKINSNAFTYCVNLKEITIPRKTQTIAAGIFSYPENMTIYGIAGTYAETYANNNNIRFVNQEIKAQTITLSDDNPKVLKGGTYTPTLIIEPADFTDEISWKSSNTNIATVTADGVINGIGLGNTTIKVIVGDVSKSFTISVVQPVTRVSLNKTSISLEALDTYKLTASVYPINADDKRIEWTTSDETVVSVDENGNIAALKKGTAKITAKALDGSGCSSVCTVTVTNNAHMAQEISEMESPHPYEANCRDFWQYTLPGADTIAVTFSEETCAEENFDYIKIYGIDKELIGTYTGSELSGRTIKILGDTVRIKIVSDDSGADYGFKVSEIRRIGEIGDANGDGKVTMSDTVRIARYVVGQAEIGSEGMILADINNDGLVTIADAILIAKYVAAQA